MGIVRFVAEPVECGEGESVHVMDAVRVLGKGGDETEARAQVGEDVGGLAQEQGPVAEQGGRKWWRVRVVAEVRGGEELDDGGSATCGIAHVCIGLPGCFEGEADWFSAAGN